MMLFGVVGCVLSTTRFYVPTTGEGRITPDQLRERADAMLHLECPQLLRGRAQLYAAADLTLRLDSAGAVTQARIDRGSGSADFDDVLGALAAQLQLPPPPPAPPRTAARRRAADPATAKLTIAYACAPTASSVTVQLRPA
jgi:hypothetical protein